MLLLVKSKSRGLSSMARSLGSAKVLTHVFLLGYSFNLLLGITFLINSLNIVYYLATRERVVNIIFFSKAVDRSLWLLSLLAIVFILILLKLHGRDLFPNRIILIQSIYLLAAASLLVGQENVGLTVAILTSLATLIGVLSSAERSLEMPRRTASVILLIYLLLLLISIEISSAIALIKNPFNPAMPIPSGSEWLLPPVETDSSIHLETEISNIPYPATPYLVVLSLFSWALIPIARALKERIAKSRRSSSTKAAAPELVENVAEGHLTPRRLSRIKPIITVGCAIVVGGFLVLCPYVSRFVTVETPQFVGVDTRTYYLLLSKMTDLEAAREIVLGSQVAGPKALYFLLLLLIKAMTGLSAMAVVKIAVVVPLSLLAISAYLLVRYGARNGDSAALSSLLAVLSFNTTVGMFAGIYANWLALAFMILSFALLIKASSQNSRKTLLASIATSILVLLTHALSWMVFTAVLFFYSATSLIALRLWKKAEAKRDLLFSLSILLASGAFALFLLFLSNLLGSNLSAKLVVSYSKSSYLLLRADTLSEFPANLSVTLSDFLGGFLASPLIYLLASIGALQGGYRRRFERLLYSWLIPTSIVFLLTRSIDQWRMLYLMPIQILAALGVFQLIKGAGLLLPEQKTRRGYVMTKLFKILLLCLIILSLFNYAARSINLLFLFFIY